MKVYTDEGLNTIWIGPEGLRVTVKAVKTLKNSGYVDEELGMRVAMWGKGALWGEVIVVHALRAGIAMQSLRFRGYIWRCTFGMWLEEWGV